MGDADLVIDRDRCRGSGSSGLAPDYRSRSGVVARRRLQLPAFATGLGLLCPASCRTSALSMADELALHARMVGSWLRVLLHTFHDPRQPSQSDCDIRAGLGLYMGISCMVRRRGDDTCPTGHFERLGPRRLEAGPNTVGFAGTAATRGDRVIEVCRRCDEDES